jgi:polysaccharide export outer membrane protein
MIDFMNSTRQINPYAWGGWLMTLVAVLGLTAGCSTVSDLPGSSNQPKMNVRALAATVPVAPISDEEISSRLRPGDELSIRIDAGAPTGTAPTPTDVTVDDEGYIELPLVGQIKAAGLTPSELAEHIQSNYVPRYYVRCTASVLVSQRFFYVGGEVKNPGRFIWSEDVTLMKAINTASGFTDYANRGKVQLARGKEPLQTFNCEELMRNPAKDVPIRPGDTITVLRSMF